MIQGFKDFISRGNAIDLAVGMVIGAAFTAVVTALVEQVINPLIGGLIGKPNFDSFLEFSLGDAVVQPGAVLTALVNFLLVALALYLFIVMPMNKMAERRAAASPAEEEPVALSDEAQLLVEIRDALVARTPLD
ncbi:large conductance mechanosensitive channel protein MscL [Actinomyces sp. B33]|uniref:large conductance mechanosensitive channel protein MscL n=1 Tax=Actinomyces sp. B33 TaxID=2942131 RepID=UPI0023419682|nr:large conductance mechanosensitive channel protein MscL [Actinomyces sp. B33]MDC4232177.1 large conductance mechanosensitive channel protein MscL [Actinomyces sp. B33]